MLWKRLLLWLVVGGVAGWTLAACGGTAVEYAGPLCGSSAQSSLTLADHKDRSGFAATCRQTYYAPDGTVVRVDEVTITSSDSSASAVIEAQATAINQLVGAALAAGSRP